MICLRDMSPRNSGGHVNPLGIFLHRAVGHLIDYERLPAAEAERI
jgi:hypothetical protein